MKKERYQTGVCEACGFTLVIDYHHPDGSEAVIDGLDWKMVPKNPENKVALCPVCHRLVHRGLSIKTVGEKVRKFWSDHFFERHFKKAHRIMTDRAKERG